MGVEWVRKARRSLRRELVCAGVEAMGSAKLEAEASSTFKDRDGLGAAGSAGRGGGNSFFGERGQGCIVPGCRFLRLTPPRCICSLSYVAFNRYPVSSMVESTSSLAARLPSFVSSSTRARAVGPSAVAVARSAQVTMCCRSASFRSSRCGAWLFSYYMRCDESTVAAVA